MLCYVPQDRRKRADAERTVLGNGDVMLAALQCGEAQVAAGLPGDPVTKGPEGLGKIRRRDIPRKPHTVITSSRTK